MFESLSPYSISGVIYTEISRDGMLKGPNLEAIQQVVQASPFPIIASGGFTRLADIHAVKKMGSKLTGVIVGKALYEGTLDLSLAIEAAAKNGQERGSC